MAKYRRKSPEGYPLKECKRGQCRKEYRQTRPWKEFCSNKCQIRDWRERHPKVSLEDLLRFLESKGIKIPPGVST